MTDEPVSVAALVERAFALLCRKYVQRADQRQKSMGLQYTEAETHDLAEVIARFAQSRIEQLERERERMREALQPFARLKFSGTVWEGQGDGVVLVHGKSGAKVLLSDW